jgi:hypothetical protein
MARRTDLQYQRRPARAKYTMKLVERADEIRNMPEGKAHAHEISAVVAQRQVFCRTLDKRDTEILPSHGEHRFAHVNADDIATTSGDSNRLAGDEPGADGHIDHTLTALKPGIDEPPAPMPGTSTQRKYSIDLVVVGRRLIEEPPNEGRALRFLSVKTCEDRMRLDRFATS